MNNKFNQCLTGAKIWQSEVLSPSHREFLFASKFDASGKRSLLPPISRALTHTGLHASIWESKIFMFIKLGPIRQVENPAKIEYAIPKKKMSCNLRCLKARLRLLCNKLSTAQQPEPHLRTAQVI